MGRYVIHRLRYKGCHIGRYTYGYKELLQEWPLATKIGPYCSINSTARILMNHSLDYVTTHPMLDNTMFYPKGKQEQREEYQKNMENILIM